MLKEEDDFIPKCTKYGVFFINCIYWLLGVLSAFFGVYVHVYQMQPIQDILSVVLSPALLMIILGGVLFVTALCGCVGTLRENICFLRWYLVTLIFLLMIHIVMAAVSVIVLFSSHAAHDRAEEILRNAIVNFKEDAHAADYIDTVQTSLGCCGIGRAGYKDWEMNPYFSCTYDSRSYEKCSVPPSCCKFNEVNVIDITCGYGTTNNSLMTQHEASTLIYTTGCIVRLEEKIQITAVVLGFLAFTSAVSILIGVLLSTHMINVLEDGIKDYNKSHRPMNKIIHLIPSTEVYYIGNPKVANATGSATTADKAEVPKTL